MACKFYPPKHTILKNYMRFFQGGVLCFILLTIAVPNCVFGQLNTSTGGNMATNRNGTAKDTTHNKSNTTTWKDEEANISYEQLGSARKFTPDTGLHTFQRRPYTAPWYRDLGNPGSPACNLMFTPEYRVGPTLGYHINDIYRFQPDSLNYYNTNRPYSVFNYQLGSKLEQVAGLMHTQNIRPNWNFMVEYRKTNAPGFYKIQRNNHDNFALTTNFKSLDKHYVLYCGMVYNKEQHDENGGIVNDTELDNSAYIDRRTIDAAYQNGQYSTSRSTVTNMQRDFGLLLQHSYTFGPLDTTYNADSTEFSYRLKPRFSITHKMQLSTEKHLYKDLAPDSLRYISLFDASLGHSGASYYIPGGDSVMTQQKWVWVDNSVLLNGFIGPDSNQLRFSAGIGNRFDQFISDPTQTGGLNRNRIVSNYVTAEIQKEALKGGEWNYGAKATFFVTGQYTDNINFKASIGRDFKKDNGSFVLGVEQNLGDGPYSYNNYLNKFATLSYGYNKESVTTLFGSIESRKLRFSGGVKNYVLSNYIYYSQLERPAQYAPAINLAQAWVKKVFKAGNWFLDNELVYQQVNDGAPINVPLLMGRNQLSFERPMFKRALKIATGIEVRYNTSYKPSGYSAVLNQFFYQNKVSVTNTPELSVFLNFRVKHFRAFIMVDQLQQLFATNAILFTGSTAYNFNGSGVNYTPVYAMQNTMLRFGFSWVLIN